MLRTIFLYERHFGSFFYVHETREKLPKQHWYKKFAGKMLMKLTPAVRYFINILHTIFLYERSFGSFFHVNVTKEKLPKWRLYKKVVHKMLMKLTPAVRDFINIIVLKKISGKRSKAKSNKLALQKNGKKFHAKSNI